MRASVLAAVLVVASVGCSSTSTGTRSEHEPQGSTNNDPSPTPTATSDDSPTTPGEAGRVQMEGFKVVHILYTRVWQFNFTLRNTYPWGIAQIERATLEGSNFTAVGTGTGKCPEGKGDPRWNVFAQASADVEVRFQMEQADTEFFTECKLGGVVVLEVATTPPVDRDYVGPLTLTLDGKLRNGRAFSVTGTAEMAPREPCAERRPG